MNNKQKLKEIFFKCLSSNDIEYSGVLDIRNIEKFVPRGITITQEHLGHNYEKTFYGTKPEDTIENTVNRAAVNYIFDKFDDDGSLIYQKSHHFNSNLNRKCIKVDLFWFYDTTDF